MTAFQIISDRDNSIEYKPLTTPPRPRSTSPTIKVWEIFQDLCTYQEDQSIYLYMTALIRTGNRLSQAYSAERKIVFNFDETNPEITERIRDTFDVTISAQFAADVPSMQVIIDQKEWAFKIEESVEEDNKYGLKLVANFENPLIDDMSGDFHFINGNNELFITPFFTGVENFSDTD